MTKDDHVRPCVKERVALGRPMSYEEYDSLAMNSYEREALLPILDDDCLEKVIAYCNSQIGTIRVAYTYQEGLLRNLYPEVMKRWKKGKFGE